MLESVGIVRVFGRKRRGNMIPRGRSRRMKRISRRGRRGRRTNKAMRISSVRLNIYRSQGKPEQLLPETINLRYYDLSTPTFLSKAIRTVQRKVFDCVAERGLLLRNLTTGVDLLKVVIGRSSSHGNEENTVEI